MLKVRFHGTVIMCKSCGSELFEEVTDDHCQIFRCMKCGEFIAFGNKAMVERIKVRQDPAGGDNNVLW
ncbi:MAG: hypothetical protein HPY52_16540 [Firmicutes bacterium]|nr:hypothetical protein [Bacillota bacterium]